MAAAAALLLLFFPDSDSSIYYAPSVANVDYDADVGDDDDGVAIFPAYKNAI